MLRQYPVLFDDEEVQHAETWEEKYTTVEQVYQTEAGTDQVEVARYGKLSVSASYQCDSDGVAFFGAFSRLDSFVLRKYDVINGGYGTHTVRMREFSVSLNTDSDWTPNTNGVYNVSFTLEEF